MFSLILSQFLNGRLCCYNKICLKTKRLCLQVQHFSSFLQSILDRYFLNFYPVISSSFFTNVSLTGYVAKITSATKQKHAAASVIQKFFRGWLRKKKIREQLEDRLQLEDKLRVFVCYCQFLDNSMRN
jgi:hypothetical protein